MATVWHGLMWYVHRKHCRSSRLSVLLTLLSDWIARQQQEFASEQRRLSAISIQGELERTLFACERWHANCIVRSRIGENNESQDKRKGWSHYKHPGKRRGSSRRL